MGAGVVTGILTDTKVDTARLLASIFERRGIAIDEHDPIMAVLVASAQQTEEIGAHLLRRMSPGRVEVMMTMAGLLFVAIVSFITWRVDHQLLAFERADWMRHRSDSRLAGLLHSSQGMAAMALAETGVVELLAKCNGRPNWRIEQRYCIPVIPNGKPDGFKVSDTQTRPHAETRLLP